MHSPYLDTAVQLKALKDVQIGTITPPLASVGFF
jgi:hypothetical protein